MGIALRRNLAAMLMAGAFFVAPAVAAPTCQNLNGDTVRCGTAGAMPVGWTLPSQQRQQKANATPTQLLEVISALGVFFLLLAVMPEFDGSHPEDWDREEGDDRDVRL